MEQKPDQFTSISIYTSVKGELDKEIAKAKKAGGDTNLSRLIRRALMALREVTK